MKKPLLCSSSILLLILIAVNAQADLVVFQQLPGLIPMSYNSNANSTYDLARAADDFTVSSAWTITGIRWWGFDQGGGWSGNSTFAFTFYYDSSGSPGSSLLTTSGSLTSEVWDSVNKVYVYESALNSSFNTAAGTKYWLSIFDTQTDSKWGWMMSDDNPDGVFTWSYQKFGDGAWSQNEMYSNAAFELTGSPVPIPSAAWLLGSGLIALVLMGRRIRIR